MLSKQKLSFGPLFLAFWFSSLVAGYSQATDWESVILRTLETKNSDTLKLIYNAWAKESKPIPADTLELQKDFIQETYKLLPEIARASKSGIAGYYFPAGVHEDSIFYYLPTTVRVEFSDLGLDQVSMARYGKPYDSIEKVDLYREIVETIFARDFISPKPRINPIIQVFNLRPYLTGLEGRIIYDNEQSVFQRGFRKGLSEPEIERSLLNEGKARDEIRQWRGGTFIRFTYMSLEYMKRYDFYTSLRLNVANRLDKIIFQPGYNTAVVVFNTGEDLSCCRQILLLFKKGDQGWKYKKVLYDEKIICDDGPDCKIK